MAKPDVKVLGFFYQGQGHFQFAVELDGLRYEGCRQLGARRTDWTTDNPQYAGKPPRGTAAAIVRAAEARIRTRHG